MAEHVADRRLSRELGRDLGVVPETKHPTYFRRLGLDLETPLLRTLDRNRLNRRGAKGLDPVVRGREPAGAPAPGHG